MAEYTNLTTLEGLQVGDVVTYTATSETASMIWKVVTKGYKIKVDINAARTKGPTGQITPGGLTIANIDCTSIENLTLYTYVRSAGLAYGTYSTYSNLLYYRLLVAGAPSTYSSTGYAADASYGKGGGVTGGNGLGSSTGGTQTDGGYGIGSYNKDLSGRFGYGGSSDSAGGAGWYGGGGCYGGSTVRGGGGSGFIIGQTTTTYPSGFLGDDTSLQTSLAAAVTEGTTTQGGSSASIPYITITILEASSSGPSQSTLNYYNGTEFKKCYATYYNGTSFIDCDAYYYDGTEFKKIGGE